MIVNPAGLAAGASADAKVTIATVQNTVEVPVKVTVTNSPLIIASPDALSFNHTLGAAVPQALSVNITGTSVLGYMVAEAEASGGDWLTV